MTEKVKRFEGRVALGMDGVVSRDNLSLEELARHQGNTVVLKDKVTTGDPKCEQLPMIAWCGKIGVAHRLTWVWSQDDYCVYASHGWSGRMNRTRKYNEKKRVFITR